MVIGMPNHEHFEELCALAVLGQVSEQEFTELKEHIHECRECGSAYAEFAQILYTKLPLVDASKPTTRRLSSLFRRNNKYRAHFVARAKELGFHFSEEPRLRQTVWEKLSGLSFPSVSYKYASAVVILGLLLTVAVSVSRWRESDARNAAASATIAKFSNETTALRQQITELSQERASLEGELSQARTQGAVLSARYKEVENQWQQALVAWQNLSTELEAAKNEGTQTNDKLREANQALSAMQRELGSLREARSQDASAIAVQEVQIADLSRRLREQAGLLERERRLLVADRDIRELMGARNLHIIDVYDVDGKGKNRQAFGRVFYTEAKSLIFYAFDLEQPRLSPANHSFQAWGEREGSSAAAVSLGILYMDNAEQRRWILKFEDPKVLRQIDALFVTVEPFGGRKRPSGEKLLYAYLGYQANHP